MSTLDQRIDLGTNVNQLFTDLYREYGIFTPRVSEIFDDSLYAEGEQATTLLQTASERLISYHRKEGTLELFVDPSSDNQPLALGCGSTALFNALLYAMSMSYPDKKFIVLQKIPYFASHQKAAELFPYDNLTYIGYETVADLPPKMQDEVWVEFVTSPNNPDGKPRSPETDADVIIGDFVFSSKSFGYDGSGFIDENIEWVRRARSQGKTVLSFDSASKSYGYTGDRIGYMWFPLHDVFAAGIFEKFKRFISTTVGVGLYGLNHFVNLLPAISGKRGADLRRNANRTLVRRHEIVSNAIAARYPGSFDVSVPGGATLFFELPSPGAAEIILEDNNVVVLDGKDFGGTDKQIRVNLMAASHDLALFVRRLLGMQSSMSAATTCKFLMVAPTSSSSSSSVRACTRSFHATPGYREIVAVCGCEEIVLPLFLGFLGPIRITIRNTNQYPLVVRAVVRGGGGRGNSSRWCVRVPPCGGQLTVVWTQPFYQNGNWFIGGSEKRTPLLSDSSKQHHRSESTIGANHFVV